MHLSRKLIVTSAALSMLVLAAGDPAWAGRRAPSNQGYVDQDFGDSYEPNTTYNPGYAARPDDELSVGEVGAGLGPFTTEESLGPDF